MAHIRVDLPSDREHARLFSRSQASQIEPTFLKFDVEVHPEVDR